MKPCPVCGEQIQDVAVKCRYCGEVFDPAIKRRRRARSGGGVPWHKRILAGFVGWAAIYMLTRMVVGGFMGGVAGQRDPGHLNDAIAEGLRNFEAFMGRWNATIVVVSGLVAFAVAGFGLLPGTRRGD